MAAGPPSRAADAAARPDGPATVRLAMEGAYAPGPGIETFRCGTPPMLSLLAMEAALSAFDGVDMVAVRAKSLSLTRLFIELADQHLAPRLRGRHAAL